jgi:hypothetical protein
MLGVFPLIPPTSMYACQRLEVSAGAARLEQPGVPYRGPLSAGLRIAWAQHRELSPPLERALHMLLSG